MSTFGHVAALVLLVADLLLGGELIGRFAGQWAVVGFEFLLILGYVLFVLQVGVPWGRRDGDEG